MLLVSLQRLSRRVPVVVRFGLLIIVSPGRIVFQPDGSCERVLFLLTGFVAIDRVED
jgi:hypothetical protein